MERDITKAKAGGADDLIYKNIIALDLNVANQKTNHTNGDDDDHGDDSNDDDVDDDEGQCYTIYRSAAASVLSLMLKTSVLSITIFMRCS